MPARVREALFGWWEATSAAALEEWSEELPGATAEFAKQLLEDAGAKAALRAAQLAGHLPCGGEGGSDEHARRAAAFLLHGPDDDEHPDHEEGLQQRLAALQARQQVEAVRAALRREGDREGEQLLDDLCHPDSDHRWLWVLATPDSTILARGEFVDAVRLRLGADQFSGEACCARCGATLDPQCRHALRCAAGPSTQGHNRVRDTLLGLASLSDGAAATEVVGLIGSNPTLRPADVLTSAACGRLCALGVGIAKPGGPHRW